MGRWRWDQFLILVIFVCSRICLWHINSVETTTTNLPDETEITTTNEPDVTTQTTRDTTEIPDATTNQIADVTSSVPDEAETTSSSDAVLATQVPTVADVTDALMTSSESPTVSTDLDLGKVL